MLRRALLSLLAATILPLAVSAASAAPARPASPQPPARSAAEIPLPDGARRVSTSELDELHAVGRVDTTRSDREAVGSNRAASDRAPVERVAGVSARDDVYRLPLAYDAAVRFYDHRLAESGFSQVDRTLGHASTTWQARRPDGTLATVVVRPAARVATVEIVQAISHVPLPRNAPPK